MPKSKLVQIFKHNLVDGFKVRGRLTTHCSCRTCAQAKIQRQPVQHQRTMDSEAEVIGHTVSSDTKEVPYKTFKGFKYCINFVDHKSRFTLIYYMRNKNESTAKLRQYVADMGRLELKFKTFKLTVVANSLSKKMSLQFTAQGGSTNSGLIVTLRGFAILLDRPR